MRLLTSPLNLIVNLFSLLLIGVVVLIVVTIAMAVSGGPSACNPSSGAVANTSFHAESFQRKWDAFKILLDSGSAASVRFNESELTSRADRYIREQTDVEVTELRVCLHEGVAEISGRFKTDIGLNVRAHLSGTADFSSHPARTDVSDVEVGLLPDLFLDLAEVAGFDASDVLDDVLSSLTIDHTYEVTVRAGEILVEGEPASQ